ncbi:peptidoglycan DD-metalloendopeptidase family protein [Sulfurovum sp. zt1-1]|uniref:Peptidoglycan DD-metalloendopeptidase family protein n=1 Tax=Sulfurovum zhangzhouensis TaxID=3019067 RepID=A0ABT7QX49_9BACT|nr:peptidoglycan DD-metalloendopeptidase family protein [Sulfurovum zhangzhouensis]MDM5271415.1 peptidoglycan DD-metalloendopeptidase family protein [Sulfurovum zhangzhouensis]
MFKSIVTILFAVTSLFGAKVTQENWEKGQTFSHYLEAHNISIDLINDISKEDQQFLSEIQSNTKFYELSESGNILLQSLIPINDEMQIHLYKDKRKGKYVFDIIPIVYEENEYFANIEINSNPYTDTLNTIKQAKIAKRVGQVLKNTINTRSLAKGDQIAFNYTQRTRLGEIYHMPDIEVVKLTTRGKTKFIYADKDGYGHLEGAENTSFNNEGNFIHLVPFQDRTKTFGMPLRHARITSSFTFRRWHPILKCYRPHHGTDFGAKRGTPLLAVYDGTVSYAGWMNGYGNVVKIKHPKGYESLYAHQSRMNVHRGQQVKKGQIIGYVGNTGRSTGPHLHFGLQKNGRWVNPMSNLQRASLNQKKFTKVVIKHAKVNKEKLVKLIDSNSSTYVWDETTSKQSRIGG